MYIDWQSFVAALASLVTGIVLIRCGYLKTSSTSFAIASTLLASAGFGFDFVLAATDVTSAITRSISDTVWMCVAAMVLSSLANFMREDKPPFARYPYFFTMLPFVVLPVFPFISDTVVIKNWVLALYQFGALVMAMLLFSLMATKDKSLRFLLPAVLLFAFSWLVKWVLELHESDRWVYTGGLVLGMIFASKSFYDKAETKTQNQSIDQ